MAALGLANANTDAPRSKQALALANAFVQKLKRRGGSGGDALSLLRARAQAILCGSSQPPTEDVLRALNAEMTQTLVAKWILPDFRATLARAFADEFSFQFSEFQEYFTVLDLREAPCDGGPANSRSVRIPWLRDDEEAESESESEDRDERKRKRRRRAAPRAIRAYLDETMVVVPVDPRAHARTAELFEAMPRILERFDATYEKHERFRKQLMVWNKMRLDNVWQYEYSNVRARNLALPMLPRALFPLPPAEVYAPLCELLFGPAAEVRPPPLLHWSLFEVNEGKLIGLNFDSPPQIARLPYHPYTQDFQKLDDAHYAVILMLSNHDRVIKYYREPTHSAKQGKKVTNTENFKLHNGEVVIVPQRKRVCVTASQITKFDAGRQKYYFFVFYYGPRFRPAAAAAATVERED